jgi:hypothetical protein
MEEVVSSNLTRSTNIFNHLTAAPSLSGVQMESQKDAGACPPNLRRAEYEPAMPCPECSTSSQSSHNPQKRHSRNPEVRRPALCERPNAGRPRERAPRLEQSRERRSQRGSESGLKTNLRWPVSAKTPRLARARNRRNSASGFVCVADADFGPSFRRSGMPVERARNPAASRHEPVATSQSPRR